MRITHLLLFGILISLAAAATKSSKNDHSIKKATSKPATSDAKAPLKPTKSSITTSTGRSAKSIKIAKAGENRGKRTLYDFGNAGYLYPQIAARRAGYDPDARLDLGTQSGYFNGQNAIAQFPSDYNLNYSPYPQYLEAPEPIIEIIIKDANETLPEASVQPFITKNKKKKEKVHVFYVNYKKDQNNKLHLESPIASLNNDDTEEEEEDEAQEEILHYTATPLPPVQSTTLRTIIHPDSEKYHSNSGIHVTFGSEDKSQQGHILEEHDAESVQRQVVAVPVPQPAIKSQFHSNARNDYHGEPRSPFTSSFFQSAAPWQYQAQQQQQPPQQQQKFNTPQQQQLPYQHSGIYFKPPPQSSPLQQFPPQQTPLQSPQQHLANFFQKPSFFQQTPQHKSHYNTNPAPSAPAVGQQSQRNPLSQIQQQLQQQSQYYVNHNQLYPSQTQQHHVPVQQQQQQQKQAKQPPAKQQPQTQSQQQQQYHHHHHHHQLQQQKPQSSIQHHQYYNALSPKATQPPKQPVVFPTSPNKNQELPVRHAPQPYQPIKFRPTTAAVPQHQLKSTPIAAKLENTQYNSKPYQFQKQPQFVQQPTFGITAPTQQNFKTQTQLQTPAQQHQPQHPQYQYQTQNQPQQHYQQPQQVHSQTQQQQQQQNSQAFLHSQTSQVPQTNSIYFTQNKNPQQQQQQQEQPQPPIQQNTRYQAQPSNQHTLAAMPQNDLNWFDVKPSKETELLKSIPKFEQHITETVENHYNHNQYQTQNQVIHDMPAPNLGSQQQPQHQAYQGHYITAPSFSNQQPQVQPQIYAQQHQQPQQTFTNFVTASSNLQHAHQIDSTTPPPQFGQSTDGQKIMIVTPMPPNIYEQYQAAHSYQSALQQSNNASPQYSTQIVNSVQPSSQEQYAHYYQQPRQSQSATQAQTQALVNNAANGLPYSVSNYHSDVFKELEQRNNKNAQTTPTTTTAPTTKTPSSTTVNPKTLLQLPDEVPDDLRQQLLSSGILSNADISVLDYDKIGDTALENLPAEHLQHFYGAGGGAQISASKKILSVLKPNGDKVSVDEKEIQRVKESSAVPNRKQTDVKIVRFDGQKLENSEAPSSSTERQYNRYLPLKINGTNFPKPDNEQLNSKLLQSVVVLAPVDTPPTQDATTMPEDSKEVKFVGGDLIKTLVKKPTRENFKRWLDKEARTDVEQQSVVLLVAKSSNSSEQEIFMYDITTTEINKLNGELSNKFVSVAEENASTEDLEHGSTLDPNFIETMMQPSSS